MSETHLPVGVLQAARDDKAARDDTGATLTLSLPGGTAPSEPAPLVVSLHYGGPVSPGYGRGLLESVVEPGLRGLQAVMVAPDCGAERWSEGPCERAVHNAIRHAREHYPVDSGRIVLAGYSKGGIGAWELGAREPDSFSAVIVMAGRPPDAATLAQWRLPLYAIQAQHDELFPPAPSVSAVESLTTRGIDARLQLLDGVTHFETHRFAEPLRQAVPWLQALWARGNS